MIAPSPSHRVAYTLPGVKYLVLNACGTRPGGCGKVLHDSQAMPGGTTWADMWRVELVGQALVGLAIGSGVPLTKLRFYRFHHLGRLLRQLQRKTHSFLATVAGL